MFRIDIDTRGLDRKLRALGPKQLAYAATNGINDAAKLLQIELQSDARKQFTIRNEFILRAAAVIAPFASVNQGRLYADVGVAIGKNKPKRLFLAQYEHGGPRADVAGSALAAAPVTGSPARPTFKSKVPTRYRYKSLALQKKGKQRKGKSRSFIIPNVGLFVRTGSGKADIKELYRFTRNQRLPDRMRFTEITQKFAPRFMREQFERELNRAIARANVG